MLKKETYYWVLGLALVSFFICVRLSGLPAYSTGLLDLEIESGLLALRLVQGEEVSWFTNEQGLLYGLFLSPFVESFGLSDSLIRLPLLFFSIVTIYVLWRLSRQYQASFRVGLMLVILTSPWHIAASTWANPGLLLPYFVLISILVIERVKATWLAVVIVSLVMILSVFSSREALLFSPLYFCVLMHGLLKIHGCEKSLRLAYVGACCLILLLLVTFFWLLNTNDVSPSLFGIPLFSSSSLTFFCSEFLLTSPNGYLQIPDQMITYSRFIFGSYSDRAIEYGHLRWGGHYFFLIPFLIFGAIKAINDGTRIDRLMLSWLILGVLVVSTFRAEMARLTLVWLPIIWLTGIGLVALDFNRYVRFFSRCIIVLFGLIFTVNYLALTKSRIENKYQAELWNAWEYALLGQTDVIVTSRAGSLRKSYLESLAGDVGKSDDTAHLAHISEVNGHLNREGISSVLLGQGRYYYISPSSGSKDCYRSVPSSSFSGEQDWGRLGINAGVSKPINTGLYVKSVKFSAGLGVHGSSSWRTVLPDGAESLNIGFGLADTATCSDGMLFSVFLDGESVLEEHLKRDQLRFVNLDVAGGSELLLKTYGGVHKLCDHGLWLRPVVKICQ